jgi:hypothetical protein
VTLEQLDRWLDAYGRAWERQDTEAFVACFTEDAAYHWGPWGEPLRGHDDIRAQTKRAISEQEGIFLVTLDADGRCTEFREWWNSRSRPAS